MVVRVRPTTCHPRRINNPVMFCLATPYRADSLRYPIPLSYSAWASPATSYDGQRQRRPGDLVPRLGQAAQSVSSLIRMFRRRLTCSQVASNCGGSDRAYDERGKERHKPAAYFRRQNIRYPHYSGACGNYGDPAVTAALQQAGIPGIRATSTRAAVARAKGQKIASCSMPTRWTSSAATASPA